MQPQYRLFASSHSHFQYQLQAVRVEMPAWFHPQHARGAGGGRGQLPDGPPRWPQAHSLQIPPGPDSLHTLSVVHEQALFMLLAGGLLVQEDALPLLLVGGIPLQQEALPLMLAAELKHASLPAPGPLCNTP